MVPRSHLQTHTYSLALEIADNTPLSLKGTKRIIHLLIRSAKIDEKDQKAAENIIVQVLNREDLKEGQRAFGDVR
jgi:enoyl-CoA hydratase/carnithine racemase